MPSIKQIGTICFALSFIIFPKFTFADNEPTVIPTPANCNEAVLNTTEGSADLEAIYTANTINTTWYSGYGNNASVSNATQCSYDGTINLPQTNPSRPGYAFDGWRLIVPAAPTGPFANLDTSINGTSYNAMGGDIPEWGGECIGYWDGNIGSFNDDYDPPIPCNTWNVTFSYGKVTGEASCSGVGGNNYNNTWNGDSSAFVSGANTMNTESGLTAPSYGFHCWCRITGFIPNNGTAQSPVYGTTETLSSLSWVYRTSFLGTVGNSGCQAGSSMEGNDTCSYFCANSLQTNSAFRTALYNTAR